MIIDFHTHAFPDALAPRAMGQLCQGNVSVPQTDGTARSLKEQMDADGVDISVVLSIATNPRQQTNVNNFAMELDRDPRLIAFGSVHPDAPNALEELERIAQAGLKGVKFHPEYQKFYVDDEKMKPIYRKISQLGLITVFHAGTDPSFPPPYHCLPRHLSRALGWFDSPVVAGHWGGYSCSADVLELLCGGPAWFDLSFGYQVLAADTARAIIDKHGIDKLVFASDMPWHRPAWERQFLDSLGLSPSDREKLFHRNAARLLGL